ncbi:MAG: flavin reductase family protein [Paludisphaera borealis]|uniref:flavin reductase family protein n=1 Tax=Paludisphaera borealis TaxID=1387353 RepID=UPI0028496E0C|nr:flavin reductase family protein [Paludisphaera borealis]MDR3622808.1 flavin reductase family protein [Paludisphaera borealis]
MHQSISPAILYLGTPVVLVSTVNENGSYNLAPMSSAFWLGWRCMLGFEAVSKSPQNLIRTGECVLNLPSDTQVDAVNRLAYLTGSNPVPPGKSKRNYQFEEDKFGASGLTPIGSETVGAARALECPIQLEAKVARVNPVMADGYDYSVHERSAECTLEGIVCIEVRITRVHAHPSILMDGKPNRIDPDRWRPLIMSFQRFYGLGPELFASRLAGIPEEMYRTPDIDRAHFVGA